MEDTKPKIHDICSKADEEFDLLRMTLEQMISQNHSFNPMMTFFSARDKRSAALVIPPQSETVQTIARISECLYLYTPMRSHCVFITLPSDIDDDDGKFLSHSISTFLLSDECAFLKIMPYTIDSNNKVVWTTEKFETLNILEKNFQGLSKEMVNLFYMFTHLEDAPYTVQEVASYLTFVGIEVLFDKNLEVLYYNMLPDNHGK